LFSSSLTQFSYSTSHKHRPKLINWSSLSKSNPTETLSIVFDAAEKYFQLEKYLTPEDIPKLDEASMVVYVSEYYYGIAEQRKMDLAARRIGKVIKLTEENHAMRKDYNEKSQKLREHLNKVEKILEDRTVDNTMAGAKRRLAEFYDYKATTRTKLSRPSSTSRAYTTIWPCVSLTTTALRSSLQRASPSRTSTLLFTTLRNANKSVRLPFTRS
jgi:hypothetical protein